MAAQLVKSQCTYRCVVLPDAEKFWKDTFYEGLNAPTGAWCSLTDDKGISKFPAVLSQCTYRCVVLPDTTDTVDEG